LKTIVQLLLAILALNSVGALLHSSSHEHVFCMEHQKLEEVGHGEIDSHNDISHNLVEPKETVEEPLRAVVEADHENDANTHTTCFLEHSLKTEYLAIKLSYEPAQYSQWKNPLVAQIAYSLDTLSIAPKASPPRASHA